MIDHLLRIADLSSDDLHDLLALATSFKADPYLHRLFLANETVVLYFNKPSTRTRISFETAVARLGGVPITIGPGDLQLGRGETIEDTARVVSRYARAFVIRTFADDEVARFAAAATIPVVNALTDRHHPCQALADLMTLREKRGPLRDVVLAYVGDGNNVAHSLIEAAALAGMSLRIATPPAFAPDAAVVAAARARARTTGASIEIGEDPLAAVRGADAIYTDVWVSMGDPEAERAARFAAFAPYQVNAALFAPAKPDAIFLHCLPDHRGEEVTAEVVDGPRAVVFDQAENRLHTAVALLYALVERRGGRG
ncbi:ornithine carbamoyltransferase [Candidatus Binatia bacterium]|nr:ornithine carbamoyltransferase [Candidatus Binatia bacterium]